MWFPGDAKVTVWEGGGGWGEVARRARFCGTRCLCPNRFRSKLMQHIFTGGFPDSCYEIQLRFMVFFILNMICYANAACDSLIKSICYHEAKRGRWDFRIMGRVREACGFVIRHHFAHCHTARGSVCAPRLVWPHSSLPPPPAATPTGPQSGFTIVGSSAV